VRLRLVTAAAALLAGPALASADVAGQLTGYEQEIRNLGNNLPSKEQLVGGIAAPHRVVDAEAAFGLGDYDTAIRELFDLVDKPGPDAEAATYYLAESLYQKGDRGAAHTYFAQLANNATTNSRYYQPALGRLVELAIDSSDDADVTNWLAKLDQVPPGLRQALVPYVRGKYAYAQGKYDDAIAFFQDVPKGSDFDLQAQFFIATIAISKQDLPRAIAGFSDLIDRPARTDADRRVIELGQLALGRLYYERDQFGKSIDAYLLIDRHSDLFPDALYEVSWVYVKNKQYDKALRALELLGRSEPDSGRTPTIRILEGNLRIRKAQMIRQAQVEGTGVAADDPAIEYDKANQVFGETHDQYYPGYVSLAHIVADHADPAQYLGQLAGRPERAFQISAPLPDEAVVIIREQPGVKRLVGVETDLDEVRHSLDQVRSMITRLDAAVASTTTTHDTFTVFPALASRRDRIAAIQVALAKLRDDLADQQLALVSPSNELSGLDAARKQLSQQLAAMPDPEKAQADHLNVTSAGYDAIERTADDVDAAIDSTGAMAVAMRIYPSVPDDQKSAVSQGLADAAKESRAIADELDAVRRELRLGRDLAEVEDASADVRAARVKLTQAQDAEHRVLAGFASASRDAKKSQDLAALGDRASRIAANLDQLDAQLDGLAQQGVALAKTTLDSERGNLAALDKELGDDASEANDAAGAVLGTSFTDALVRLYDIVIRTDVGTVDVAWSQKEDNDDDLKRLNLARARELKQLRDEFKDILDDHTPKPSDIKHKPLDLPPLPTQNGDGRVNTTNTTNDAGPGSNTTAPSVKPDDAKKTGGGK
jgi:hypothetical protein